MADLDAVHAVIPAAYAHLGYREVDRRAEDGYRRIYLEKIVPAKGQGRSAGGATS